MLTQPKSFSLLDPTGGSKIMLEQLQRFFEDYPRQILQMRGTRSADLPEGLMERLLDYRHRQLVNLEDAQYFRIEPAAYWMLTRLVSEMKSEGLEELYSQVMLPFPAMMIEIADSGGGDQLLTGVIIQIDDTIYTQRFVLRKDDLAPSSCVVISKGLKAEVIDTPTRALMTAIGVTLPEDMVEDELAWNRTFVALAVAIATLLQHEGMLKLEEVSLFPRQMRRQAERSGKPLPDTLISKIALGQRPPDAQQIRPDRLAHAASSGRRPADQAGAAYSCRRRFVRECSPRGDCPNRPAIRLILFSFFPPRPSSATRHRRAQPAARHPPEAGSWSTSAPPRT